MFLSIANVITHRIYSWRNVKDLLVMYGGLKNKDKLKSEKKKVTDEKNESGYLSKSNSYTANLVELLKF